MGGKMIPDQDTFDIAVAVAGALGCWWMRVIWQSVKELQDADRSLISKLSAIEVLVAGSYVKRDDFDRLAEAIFKKLDRIEDKLDQKVDKA
jgi:hypothetical protein